MSVKIFSTSKSKYLGEKIAHSYGNNLDKSELNVFSDGEFCPALNENVREETVFIISSLYSSYNEADKILELIPQEKNKDVR